MIDYPRILSPARLRSSSLPGRTILTESESDRGRILFSPAFRRLQQKAQVFSMEPNAAVRSRLTHSLEVSQLGRFLADEICQRLVSRLDASQQGALVNFVESACLMHDIGNPPFGHFGEAAIQEWFKQNGEACFCESMGAMTPNDAEVTKALADFVEFDGNPQGLRIVSRLQWNTDAFGLNLTKTTMASFLKYVRSPLEPRTDAGFRKKPGYFTTESEIVEEVWREFAYNTPQRFPLAYVMEAADDIAYCGSDLEDSLEKGIVDKRLAFPEIERLYNNSGMVSSMPCHSEICSALRGLCEGHANEKEFTFTDFRTRVNNAIVRYAAARYVENEEQIADGSLTTLLPEDAPPGHLLNVLKTFCREHVYNHVSVQRVELAGYNAISGLLDQFRPLLAASRARFDAASRYAREDCQGRRILLEPKLLRLFPEKYRKVYDHQVRAAADSVAEWNMRAHLVVDFISGMTDDFAMTTYRTLAGMEL